MQTKPKSNSVITHTLNADGTLTFNVLGAGSFVFDPKKVHASNRQYAEIHGWVQRHSDGAAKSRDPATGKPASPAEKLAAMVAIKDHYESGTAEWNMRGGPSGTSLLFRALAEAYIEKTPMQLRDFIDGLSKHEQTALLSSDKLRPIVERMRAEAGRGIDADKLLEGLE